MVRDRSDGRQHADGLATLLHAEGDRAADQGEQRVVATATDAVTGVEVGAALAHDDLASADDLATVEGVSRPLPLPFMVVATQNPSEHHGTYPLPEAQVDRFMLKVIIDYPTKTEEQNIIRQNVQGMKQATINPVVATQEIISARELVRQVYMDEKVEHYILDIVFATRYPEKYNLPKLKPLISFGGSPRASSYK